MKLKRILSLFTALAMGVTMLCATSLTASAVDFDATGRYLTNSIEDDDFLDLLTTATINSNTQYEISADNIILSEESKQYIIPSNLTIDSNCINLSNGSYITLENGVDFSNVNEINILNISSLQSMQNFYYNNTKLIVNARLAEVFSSDLTMKNNTTISVSADSELENGKTQTYNNELNLLLNNYSFTNSGTLKVKNGLKINYGEFINNGDLYIDGTITLATGSENEKITNNNTIYSDFVFNNLDIMIRSGKFENNGTVFNSDGTKGFGKTPVTAKTTIPQPSYTVTIPAIVDFGEVAQALPKYENETYDGHGNPIVVSENFTVTAECNDFFDKTMKVTIGQTGDSFLLKGGTSTIPTTITCGDNAYTMGDTFATFEDSLNTGANNTQSGKISINRTKITESADYDGTLTFIISVAEVE